MCKCGGATSHEHGLVPETVQKKSLHPYIDFNGVTCLNAKKTHLADLPKILRATFYPALNVVLESDTDQQLLLKISEADFTSPSEMKAFTNSPDLDFVSAESRPATQTWQLVAPSSITAEPIEYATKERALRATKSSSLQDALDWLDAHGDDPGIEADVEEKAKDDSGESPAIGNNCLKCNECGKQFTTVDFAQLHATKTGHDDFSETTEKVPVLTPEEKAQRLAELKERLLEKRKQDVLKVEDQAKQNELIRRKAAKDTLETKRQLEQKEMEKAVQERQREKEEDRRARERVKQQIEEDRQRMREKAERVKMLAEDRQPAEMPQQPVIFQQPSKVMTDSARLQIRLPDGSVIRETVSSGLTLGELLNLIQKKSGLALPQCGLMVPIPPRTFDPQKEAACSLAALGLCPSATLVLTKKH